MLLFLLYAKESYLMPYLIDQTKTGIQIKVRFFKNTIFSHKCFV